MQITIGADVIQSLANAAGSTNDSLWPLVAVAIAIPLGFYVMRRLIGMLPKGGRSHSFFMISLPTDFVQQVASSSTSIIAGLSGYIELILGVLLAAVVVGVLIHAIKR